MKLSKAHRGLFYLLSLIAIFFIAGSCRKDDSVEPVHILENRDFFQFMTDHYYWSDQMPAIKPDSYRSVYEVLEAVRYRPVDVWSYISTKKEFDDYYNDSKFVGYGFGSAWDNELNLRVTFIYNSVDLFFNGVRRGWIIKRINGIELQPGMNINQMLGPSQIGFTNTFTFINPDGGMVEMSVAKKEVFMNSVIHREVIEHGGTTIGYMVFNGFTQPTFDELDEAYNFFSSHNIEEFILDLRYNGGGQTNVANYLASMLGGDLVTGEPFARYEFNEAGSSKNFVDTFMVVTSHFSLTRLFVIATGATASASEMVINGLKPFMPVYLIGDNTYGKPMGMEAWYYGDKYTFVPVTFKISNALGEGDYFDGFAPDSYAVDDLTKTFGDLDELSLLAALNMITDGEKSGLHLKRRTITQPYQFMRGLRAEIGSH